MSRLCHATGVNITVNATSVGEIQWLIQELDLDITVRVHVRPNHCWIATSVGAIMGLIQELDLDIIRVRFHPVLTGILVEG